MTLRPRPWLDRIEPYTPGRQAPSGHGSMASNELAIGASPAVAGAVAEAARRIHRYPDPLAGELRTALAAHHDVHPDQILVGNGSDELIYLLALAFLAHGGVAVCASPSYRIDEISAYVVDATVIGVPLRGWAHDLRAMAAIEADVAYVVNPHNPTGTVCPRLEIEELARAGRAGLVVVDEAYIDFADAPEQLSVLPLAREGAAVVLRTFSKAHGLAGARVGYLVGSRDVVDTLRKIRPPFSVGALSQAAAIAALADRKRAALVRQETLRMRHQLVGIMEGAGYEVVPSQANFVLVCCTDEEGLLELLGRHGISARPGRSLGVPGSVRITVPSDVGFEMLTAALRVPDDAPPATGPVNGTPAGTPAASVADTPYQTNNESRKIEAPCSSTTPGMWWPGRRR